MSMLLRFGVALGIIGALSFLWVWQCTGPDPAVTNVHILAPEEEGAPYQVQVAIRNSSSGSGEVTVSVALIDDETGESYQASEPINIEFGGKETVIIMSEIAAPPGSYTAKVHASYPPK